MRALSVQSGISERELEPYFNMHPVHYELEKGAITPEEFLERLSADYQRSIDLSIEELSDILGKSFSLNNPLQQTVDQFRPPLRVILLSNTNAIDIPYIEKQFQLLSWADEAILSYQVSMRKPDHHIYQYALHEYDLEPQDTLFIDDLEINVLAAREVGVQAEVYRSPEQVQRLLSQLVH